MKYLILSFLIASSTFATSKVPTFTMDEKNARIAYNSFLSTLIPSLKTKTKSNFKTSGCRIPGKKVAGLILMSKPFTHKFKFKKKCDLQGDYKPVLNKPFDVSLKVRNLQGFETIKMKMLIKLDMTKDFRVIFSSEDTKLTKKKADAEFRFVYNVKADVFEQKLTSLGGEIQLLSINGKKLKNKPTKIK